MLFDAKRDPVFRVIALRVPLIQSVGGLNFEEVEACLVSMFAAGDLWNRQSCVRQYEA